MHKRWKIFFKKAVAELCQAQTKLGQAVRQLGKLITTSGVQAIWGLWELTAKHNKELHCACEKAPVRPEGWF